MEKETQKERLIKYLAKNESIDPLKSWIELGIYRLSAVVYELRRDGFNIITERKEVFNKYGDGCMVANYKLN